MAHMPWSSPSLSASGAKCLVGTLVRWDPDTRKASDPLDVYSSDEVYIGRDKKNCQFVIQNPFVSNKHLRIYTILFDQENPQEVPPLVYAQDLSMNGTLWNEYPMGKANGSFLLSDGDVLRVTAGVYIRFRSAGYSEENRMSYLQRIEMREFKDRYVITQRLLGSGAYGRVHMAFKRESGQQLACKIVDLQALKAKAIAHIDEEQKSKFFAGRAKSTPKDVVALRRDSLQETAICNRTELYQREALILAKLSHPNIISVEKVIRSSNTIYLFQELVTAGDLFSFISYKGGRLEDDAAAMIIHQILFALEYLHDQNIVHRDLKPDNILMTSLADGGRVVLTDFGCARLVNLPAQRMLTIVGTMEYCAPEVNSSNRRGYTKAVDLWSLGCVTAVVVTGCTPFEEQQSSMATALTELERELTRLNTGSCAKDFLHKMLVTDESKRLDVKQALDHEWFKNPTHQREFEELYHRSTKDWKPRLSSHEEPVIVDLSNYTRGTGRYLSSVSGTVHKLEDSSQGASIDHISESSYGESQTHKTISSKLSTPSNALRPPHGVLKHEKITIRNFGPRAMKNDKWSQGQRPQRLLQQSESRDKGSDLAHSNSKPVPHQPAASATNDTSTCVNRQIFFKRIRRETSLAFAQVSLPDMSTVQQPPILSPKSLTVTRPVAEQPFKINRAARDPSEEEDEVYEEVRNPVTGKRQRRIYGKEIDLLRELL